MTKEEFYKQELTECAQNSINRYSNTLYHYTTLTALKGMLFEKNELWLGNTAFMNDKKELTGFIDRLKTTCLEIIEYQNIKKCEKFFSKVYEYVNQSFPYIMSFTKRSDDAAQWERYSDNGRGICIEFNTGAISKIFHLISHSFLQMVYYSNTMKNHPHCNNIKEWIDNDILPYGFGSESGFISNIVATSSAYKHESFNAEDEIRYVILIINNSSKYINIEYELQNNIIKKYAKINLIELCNAAEITIQDLFNGIIIGPRSMQNDHVLHDYLKQAGYEKIADNIKHSECPLR